MTEHDLVAAVIEAVNELLTHRVIPAGPAAQTAWDSVVAKVENLHAYQASSNEAERPRGLRVNTCAQCYAAIFFARDDRRDGRWVPFELDPIPPDGVLPAWLWTVDFGEVSPVATVTPTLTQGSVYVDHRQTCGLREGPRYKCAPYLRRYKVNVERANQQTETLAEELKRMHRHLQTRPEP